jgi:hypothetical protein
MGAAQAQRGKMVELGFKHNPMPDTAIYDTTEKELAGG